MIPHPFEVHNIFRSVFAVKEQKIMERDLPRHTKQEKSYIQINDVSLLILHCGNFACLEIER